MRGRKLGGAAVAAAILSAYLGLLLVQDTLDSNTDRSQLPPSPIVHAGIALLNRLPLWYSRLLPPPAYTLQLATAFIHSKAVYIAAKLGVADALWDPSTQRARALPIGELAVAVGADRGKLHRLMRALAGVGIFTQLDQGRFTNNAASGVLRRDHPNSVRNVVLISGGASHWAIQKMYESILEGNTAPSFELVSGRNFWDYLAQPGSEEVQEVFDRAMVEGSLLSSPGMLQDYPWARHANRTVADVGGGVGDFLSRLLAAEPGLRGVLFDRAPVIVQAWELWGREHPGLLSRVEFVSGSFFDPASLPQADVYFLRHIIHDWGDEPALDILKALWKACQQEECTALIAEAVLPDHQPSKSQSGGLVGPVHSMLDLQMMSMVGGKERSRREFIELLQGAGFDLVKVWPVRGLVSILEARPRANVS